MNFNDCMMLWWITAVCKLGTKSPLLRKQKMNKIWAHKYGTGHKIPLFILPKALLMRHSANSSRIVADFVLLLISQKLIFSLSLLNQSNRKRESGRQPRRFGATVGSRRWMVCMIDRPTNHIWASNNRSSENLCFKRSVSDRFNTQATRPVRRCQSHRISSWVRRIRLCHT